MVRDEKVNHVTVFWGYCYPEAYRELAAVSILRFQALTGDHEPQAVDGHYGLFVVNISDGDAEGAEHGIVAISYFKFEAIHFHLIISSVYVKYFVAGQLELCKGRDGHAGCICAFQVSSYRSASDCENQVFIWAVEAVVDGHPRGFIVHWDNHDYYRFLYIELSVCEENVKAVLCGFRAIVLIHNSGGLPDLIQGEVRQRESASGDLIENKSVPGGFGDEECELIRREICIGPVQNGSVNDDVHALHNDKLSHVDLGPFIIRGDYGDGKKVPFREIDAIRASEGKPVLHRLNSFVNALNIVDGSSGASDWRNITWPSMENGCSMNERQQEPGSSSSTGPGQMRGDEQSHLESGDALNFTHALRKTCAPRLKFQGRRILCAPESTKQLSVGSEIL
ncbi:unnamed protein product [Menidia menidia]|uniref:(Atlantic silverside) hypothetical protein n=1 Tax=Menidia menidia TaxID=238744 RepID=A0A8S4BKE4_9TELE|nr:unnamed protein product [Menidia menidia]